MMHEQNLKKYSIGILAANVSAGLQNPKVREDLIKILDSVLGEKSAANVLRDHENVLLQRKFGDKLQLLSTLVLDVCRTMLINEVRSPEIEAAISKLINREFKLNNSHGKVFTFLEQLDREQELQFNVNYHRRYIDGCTAVKPPERPTQDSIDLFYERLDEGINSQAFRASPEYSLWQLQKELSKNPIKTEQLTDFIDLVDQNSRLKFLTSGLKEAIVSMRDDKIDDFGEALKEQLLIRFSEPNVNLELRFKEEARNAILALGLDSQTFSNALVL